MKEIIVIGPTYCDLLLQGFNAVPLPGEEYYLDGYHLSPGGIAITATVLAQLEISTALVTTIGDDPLGTYVANALTKKGVNLKPSLPRLAENTNLTVVLPLINDRSFLTCEQNTTKFTQIIEERIARLNPAEFSHVHISYSLLSNRKVNGFLQEIKHQNGTASSDLGFIDTRHWKRDSHLLLENLDFFFPNLNEALAITGCSNANEAIHFLQKYVDNPIITMGGDGACALDANNQFIQVHPPQTVVTNTTGSGDSFTAGFLFGKSIGSSLTESLKYGVAAGSLTAASQGSLSELITRKKLSSMISTISGGYQ